MGTIGNTPMEVMERKIDRMLKKQDQMERALKELGQMFTRAQDIETMTAKEAAALYGMKADAFNNGMGKRMGRVQVGRGYVYNKRDVMDGLRNMHPEA